MPNPTAPAASGAMPLANRPASRRQFLAGTGALAIAAAHSVPILAAKNTGSDPIFDMIERHRQALATYSDAIGPADEIWCKQNGLQCTDAACAALDAAEATEREALDAVLDTPPQTLAGLRAVIEYIAEIENYCSYEYGARALQTLLRSPFLVG